MSNELLVILWILGAFVIAPVLLYVLYRIPVFKFPKGSFIRTVVGWYVVMGISTIALLMLAGRYGR